MVACQGIFARFPTGLTVTSDHKRSGDTANFTAALQPHRGVSLLQKLIYPQCLEL
jgi:hypothetical protein